jgi:hypothetical protein
VDDPWQHIPAYLPADRLPDTLQEHTPPFQMLRSSGSRRAVIAWLVVLAVLALLLVAAVVYGYHVEHTPSG